MRSKLKANTGRTEFLAAHNLLIHLVHQSPNTNSYLQRICRNLTTGDVVSTQTRLALSLSALTTIFNNLEPDDPIRYPVFDATLQVVARTGSFDALRPQLKNLDAWIAAWGTSASQSRRLFLNISRMATEAGEPQQGYYYLIKALRTVPNGDASGQEAKELSVQALRAALGSPTHFDFEDLTGLDSVQALRTSEPEWFQLLEIFTSDSLEEFNGFREGEHPGWLAEQRLDEAVLTRKMRLLTLASLAAQAGQTRALPYKSIADALQVPSDEVEMWVIDVIRAGLVEGKLSQLNQTFLIHRSTYRVFGDNQWREVAGRLDMWRASLRGVLEVIRAEKEGMIRDKEAELRQMDSKMNGAGVGGGFRRNRGDAVDLGMD